MTRTVNFYGDATLEEAFSWSVTLTVFALLECLVILQAIIANADHSLTVLQMRQRGISHGLPFVWHFAMWSDLLIISPLAAYLVGRHYSQWSFQWTLVSLLIGLSSSCLLHWFYTFSGMPEAHVQDHQLTAAGIVHGVYMGVALSIFVQFFLFTKGVSSRILGVISVLLLLHVIIGAHMLLGVVNWFYPLEWYPGHPFRSLFGWLTIGAVTLGLFWRNHRNVDKRWVWQSLKESYILQFAIEIWGFWTLQKLDTPEKYFRFLDYIADRVGIFSFVAVFAAKVQLSTALEGGVFHLGNWISFIKDTAFPCGLILLLGAIYAFSRHSVKLELAIGPKLFPPGRVPTDWGGPKERVIVLVSVMGFLLFYLLLTWFADNIKVASFLMFIIACVDWRTRYLIEDGIGRYFKDSKYAPKTGEKDYEVISERREIAKEFLFKKPHLIKETGRVLGCWLAFVISMTGYFNDTSNLDVIAYLILMGTLIFNEYFTLRWRFMMYKKMKPLI